MGYSLSSKDDNLYLNTFNYGALLKLAYDFGWNPKGTRLPTWIVDSLVEGSKSQLPFITTFTFALSVPSSGSYKESYHSDHKLTEQEKEAILIDPEAYFNLKDVSDVSDDPFDTVRIFERPIRVVKVVEEQLESRPVLVFEEVMASWDGCYFDYAHQVIEADDSLEISKALKRASKQGHDGLNEFISFFQGGAIQID